MLLTRFVRCSSCGREVRVFDAPVGRRGAELGLPEDAAVAAPDGSFDCPFCHAAQQPPDAR